ncbi:hypothetical protein RRG08_003466 [Elysia crispata]|uniref:Uncharacterized protein n=1 Tax=Elysia crispata TaxID=231223 RepID=A0AAE1CTJ2_9GAST|nr:hypothetical protein RRG08_003466 [Elysia crispata]
MVLAGLLLLVSLVGHTGASGQTNVDTASSRHKRSTSDCAECCEGVCLTVDCIKEAAQISQFLDRNVDPCDNFAKFACGNFYKTVRIRKNQLRAGTFENMWDENDKTMKDVLLQEIKPTDRPYQRRPKMYFKSCMDVAQREKIGLQPYLDTTFAKEWPTLLGSAWKNSTNFDIADLNARYSPVIANPLLNIWVQTNAKNNSIYQISVSGRGTSGIQLGYYRRPRNGTILMAYEKYLRDMAIELGAEPSVAAKDASTVVDMEIALVKIYNISSNKSENYNEFTLESLPQKFFFMDLPRTIRETFARVDKTIPDSEKLILWDNNLTYFNSLEEYLNNYTERDIRNLFGFSYARTKAMVTKRMSDISYELFMALYGLVERPSLFEGCFQRTQLIFGYSLSLGFIRELYSERETEEAKQQVLDMVENVRIAVLEKLNKVSWMRNTTKAAAIEKTQAMKKEVIYPEGGFNENALDLDPDWIGVSEDNFYKNEELVSLYGRRQLYRKLGTRPKNTWRKSYPSYMMNAFHDFDTNTIYLLTGILRPPLFSTRYMLAHNYGAIGSVIGHEIIHGFDVDGSQYDNHGNLRNWWDDEDKVGYDNATQCFVQQYDNHTYPQLKDRPDVRQNAKKSVGEIAADSSGIRHSYNAYRKEVDKLGEEEKMLPGLGLSPDQLFFVTFAQVFCSKETLELLIYRLVTHAHPKPIYRILSTLRNFPEFSQTFNCSLGSPMNPERKCSLFGD